jgi:uncharacterized protein (TIGR00725 family)
VIGTSTANAEEQAMAEAVGAALAQAGAILVCGGGRGVMEAACRGAAKHGGLTVGLLPGEDRGHANPHVKVALPTGIGELRNGLVVRAADAVIAVGGAYGTLSEIALALRAELPVVGLNTWPIDGVLRESGPEEAVRRALELGRGRRG